MNRLFQPTDIASLVVFRICFGLLMAFEAYRYLTLGLAHVEWVEPAYHFSYPGFHWVGVWPGEGIYLHFYALMLLGLLIAAGFLYRLSAALFCLGFTYVFLLDRTRSDFERPRQMTIG